MNRREFFRLSTAGALMPVVAGYRLPRAWSDTGDPDEDLCIQKFEIALSEKLADKPINEVIAIIGRTFIGTEYAAHILEAQGEERLVVNMRALDCVSFYENALVLARCIKADTLTFAAYKTQLRFIRYRGGVINGYPSRLHYTTDYWHDNEIKGVLIVATTRLFPADELKPIPKPINFMTTHRAAYRQLENAQFLEQVRKQEEEINSREILFLPKERMALYADRIQNGSLIGITTTIAGMDIAHTGIGVRMEDGSLHFMHAPIAGQRVQITEQPMHEYLAGNAKHTGIIVAEALEPHEG